jgi:hypothetical protein
MKKKAFLCGGHKGRETPVSSYSPAQRGLRQEENIQEIKIPAIDLKDGFSQEGKGSGNGCDAVFCFTMG